MAEASTKVGVEFVVKGLATLKDALSEGSKGLNTFRKAAIAMKNGLEAIKPSAGILEKAVVSLGKAVKNFAQNIIQRILVIAFGVLVRDAIRKVIDVFGDMIRTVVEAANEFQALEVRLNTFNMNALVESGMAFNEAMDRSIALTKEQLGWTIKLAVQSPYDATDISSAYSLARSYGFVDTKAKQLTDAITNFASGMGLSNESIERIVTNFGQMVQQGKITGTELRDLARGSFVPVNKILGMVADNLGITTAELDKMRKAGTTDPQWFIDAFIQLAETDFAGAAEKMSRTLPKAFGNLKDLFVGMPALYSIKPMFDAIGGGIADIVESFKGAKLEALISSFKRIGLALSEIVRGIFNLLPGTESVSDSIVGFFENIARWLQTNKGAIVEWVKNAIVFLKDLSLTIKNDVIPAISTFFKWVYDNRETIMKWGEAIVKIWLFLEGLRFTIRLIIGILTGFLGWLIKIFTALIGYQVAIKSTKYVLDLFGISIGSLASMFGKLVGWVGLALFAFEYFKARVQFFSAIISEAINFWKYALSDEATWKGIGERWVQGIAVGLYNAAPWLWNAINWLANTAIRLFNQIFGIHSPSKVMFDAGINITKGMAKGITNGSKEVLSAASTLAVAVSDTLASTGVVATDMTSGVSTSSTKNYLSNTGEVMRSTLEETKGDPCAKGTAASCAADKVAGALGGISSALSDSLDELGFNLEDMFTNYLDGISKGMEKTDGMVKEVTRQHGESARGILDQNKESSKLLKESSKITQDSVKSMTDGAKEGAKRIANTASMSLISTGINTVIQVTNLVAAAISKINSYSSGSNSSYQGGGSSNTYNIVKTNNITNNFSKGGQKGEQFTFDYEQGNGWA